MYTINDDILLNIFYLYRLHIADEEEDKQALFIRRWDRQRWWYKLTHVCRSWRRLILDSPTYLDLHLVCTYGVPVADMLKHSPRPGLPLTIFYDAYRMTTKGEEDVLLAILQYHDCVRRIALRIPTANLERLIGAMTKEFPALERLYLKTSDQRSPSLILPQTFHAPNLRYIDLSGVVPPIQPPFLTNTRGLVSLWLCGVPGSDFYFIPKHILPQLSLIPQLEKLGIDIDLGYHYNFVDATIQAQVHLPNLGLFYFRGVSTYLEGMLARITAPVLSTFHVHFVDQPTFTTPQPFQLRVIQSLLSNVFEVAFDKDSVEFRADSHRALWKRPLHWRIACRHPSRQITSAMQILHTLTPILSGVEQLILTDLQRYNEISRTQWRELLRLFNNVKVLHLTRDAVWGIDYALYSEDGGSPLELLPHLEELTYLNDIGDAFVQFINKRQAVGRPVHLSPRNLSD
jgi:hypothetical protein